MFISFARRIRSISSGRGRNREECEGGGMLEWVGGHQHQLLERNQQHGVKGYQLDRPYTIL